jgi:DNA processing protein
VLGAGAERPYPASKRQLYNGVVAAGAVVSEMPPGTRVWKWGFPARNRIIAGLSSVTVVVEANDRSGSLITATMAGELGREVAAVPGRVTAPLSAGTNALIADGARLVRGAQDVLDLLFGAGAVRAPGPAAQLTALAPDLRRVHAAVANGHDTLAALTALDLPLADALRAVGELELRGLLHRAAGGRYEVVA